MLCIFLTLRVRLKALFRCHLICVITIIIGIGTKAVTITDTEEGATKEVVADLKRLQAVNNIKETTQCRIANSQLLSRHTVARILSDNKIIIRGCNRT